MSCANRNSKYKRGVSWSSSENVCTSSWIFLAWGLCSLARSHNGVVPVGGPQSEIYLHTDNLEGHLKLRKELNLNRLQILRKIVRPRVKCFEPPPNLHNHQVAYPRSHTYWTYLESQLFQNSKIIQITCRLQNNPSPLQCIKFGSARITFSYSIEHYCFRNHKLLLQQINLAS